MVSGNFVITLCRDQGSDKYKGKESIKESTKIDDNEFSKGQYLKGY